MGIACKILAVIALVTLPLDLTLWRKSHTAPVSYRFDVLEFNSMRVVLRDGVLGIRVLSMPSRTNLDSSFRGALNYDPTPNKSSLLVSSVRNGPYRVTWFVFPFWMSSAILVFLSMIPVVQGPLRRSWRLRRGHCIECGYDLRGNKSGRCPECGTRFR